MIMQKHQEVCGSITKIFCMIITGSKSFKSKARITGRMPADVDTKYIEIAVSLKQFSNFWRTLEISLINFEINLVLASLANYVITNSTNEGAFTITDTKLYFRVVSLSTQDNAQLRKQLEAGFKQRINWNKS